MPPNTMSIPRTSSNLIRVLPAGGEVVLIFRLIDPLHVDDRIGRATGGEEDHNQQGKCAHRAAFRLL